MNWCVNESKVFVFLEGGVFVVFWSFFGWFVGLVCFFLYVCVLSLWGLSERFVVFLAN